MKVLKIIIPISDFGYTTKGIVAWKKASPSEQYHPTKKPILEFTLENRVSTKSIVWLSVNLLQNFLFVFVVDMDSSI